jgi:hypothetical protein
MKGQAVFFIMKLPYEIAFPSSLCGRAAKGGGALSTAGKKRNCPHFSKKQV